MSHAPKIHRLMMYNICWNKECALARILWCFHAKLWLRQKNWLDESTYQCWYGGEIKQFCDNQSFIGREIWCRFWKCVLFCIKHTWHNSFHGKLIPKMSMWQCLHASRIIFAGALECVARQPRGIYARGLATRDESKRVLQSPLRECVQTWSRDWGIAPSACRINSKTQAS